MFRTLHYSCDMITLIGVMMVQNLSCNQSWVKDICKNSNCSTNFVLSTYVIANDQSYYYMLHNISFVIRRILS